MNPYRSVSGGWSLVNLVAVVNFALELWKKEPRFWRDSKTVGGLLSSGTIDDSSTLGGGVSADGLSVPGEWSGLGRAGAIAVVGNGLDDARFIRAGRGVGRAGAPSVPRPSMAALPCFRRVRPTATVAAIAWSP